MSEEKMYTIGEVSKICNVSTKALRYYDKIGIIAPDYISEENGYRYYSRKTLLTVPVLKYYKQMGFKLEEMQELLGGNTYYFVEQNFRSKIEELEVLKREIHNSYTAVKDWYELVQEAELVTRNGIHEVAVKFVNESVYCYMEQEFHYQYMESIINIDWTNYLEEIQHRITGPVILAFPSMEEKRQGTCKTARIMQKSVLTEGMVFGEREGGSSHTAASSQMAVGGFMAASVYHIGELETIDQEYEKILSWAANRGYRCGPECYERYVVDYWTTRNPEEFVTEVIVPVTRITE